MIGETIYTAPADILHADFNDRYAIVVYSAYDEQRHRIKNEVNVGPAEQAIMNLSYKESN